MATYEPPQKKARPYETLHQQYQQHQQALANGIQNGIPHAAAAAAAVVGANGYHHQNGGVLDHHQQLHHPYVSSAAAVHQISVVADEHGMLSSALGSKTKPCTKFFSTSGCPYGERCHFLHYVPGGIVTLGLAPLSNVSTSSLAAGGVVRNILGTGVGGVGGGGGAGVGGGNASLMSAAGGGAQAQLGSSSLVAAAMASDPSVTVGGYKTRLCNRYNTAEGCRFGEKCHFAHGESDLRPSNTRGGNAGSANGRGGVASAAAAAAAAAAVAASSMLDYSGHMMAGGVGGGVPVASAAAYNNGVLHPPAYISPAVASALYYGEPTPPGVTAAGFGPTSTTKISIEAVFAGAIIGKAGANVKQISRLTGAKLSIREHETDPNMRNVEMEGSLEQIESASEMVRQFLQNREMAAPKLAILGSHNFKTKLCENFVQGTCTFADRCHFAHGQGELRGSTTAMR